MTEKCPHIETEIKEIYDEIKNEKRVCLSCFMKVESFVASLINVH